MKLIKTWISTNVSHTKKVAKELSKIFKKGDIILLHGTLGSGKTYLVQHICKNWQIYEEVTSPTFTIVQNYGGLYSVNHMDLYRIENMAELDNIGWEDMLYSDAVSFIEWPEKIQDFVEGFYKIGITLDGDKREIKLYKS